jgi:hypothetical protein
LEIGPLLAGVALVEKALDAAEDVLGVPELLVQSDLLHQLLQELCLVGQ